MLTLAVAVAARHPANFICTMPHRLASKCNRFLRATSQRVDLIERIGLEVLAVEQDNEPRKFDIEYLARIKRIFTKKAKRQQARSCSPLA